MGCSGLWSKMIEDNLPYGWEHTHPKTATTKCGREVNIDFLCHCLGRYRKGTQDWERCCALGIDYEAGLGDGIVRQNAISPDDGHRLFPDWVMEIGFPAPPRSPSPVYQGLVQTQAQRDYVHGGEIRYAPDDENAPRNWFPDRERYPPPPPPAPRVNQYADQIPFAPSNWASFSPPPAPVAAAPQYWDSPEDSLPASFEAPSFPPARARARAEPQYEDPTNDCAMTFCHAPAVNPWAIAANRPPSPAPASIEADVMPSALPEQNWHPENPFPAEHSVPFFSPPPAPAPAPVDVDVPRTDEEWRAGFEPAVLTDPVRDTFKHPGLTDAEAHIFASSLAEFDL